MSRSNNVEYETFNAENYEILINLPEHVKALYRRLEKLEKKVRVLSEVESSEVV